MAANLTWLLCILLSLVLLIIFIVTGSCVLTSGMHSYALHFHDNGDPSEELLHPNFNTKTKSRDHEAPRTNHTPLRGRKLKKDSAASTVRNSGSSHHQGGAKTSTAPARKRTADMGSFVSCADYGGPRRHPPKNN